MSTSTYENVISNTFNTSRSLPTFKSLPEDILYLVLEQLSPTEIIQYSQVNRFASKIAANPSVWAAVARRRLAIVPPHPSIITPAAVRHLAEQLSCHWWLVTGALVPGVPVHRRNGFVNIQARGGCPIPLHPDKPETCYVFGPQYADRSIPVSQPCLAADFFIDPAGPFPVDGMVLRVVHAIEHADSDTCSVHSENGCSDQILGTIDQHVGDSHDDDHQYVKQHAKITIKVNNTNILEEYCPEGLDFSVLDIPISADVLYTRPRVNTISIEYSRNSTMAYWLRDIQLVAKILPLPKVDPATLKFKSEIVNNSSMQEAIEEEEEELNHTPQPNSRSHRNDESGSRRATRRTYTFVSKRSLGEIHNMARYQNLGKYPKTNKMPKHLYHHNHYRSPRGFAPGSPGRSRSMR